MMRRVTVLSSETHVQREAIVVSTGNVDIAWKLSSFFFFFFNFIYLNFEIL